MNHFIHTLIDRAYETAWITDLFYFKIFDDKIRIYSNNEDIYYLRDIVGMLERMERWPYVKDYEPHLYYFDIPIEEIR